MFLNLYKIYKNAKVPSLFHLSSFWKSKVVEVKLSDILPKITQNKHNSDMKSVSCGHNYSNSNRIKSNLIVRLMSLSLSGGV